jgi:hypothetical protein
MNEESNQPQAKSPTTKKCQATAKNGAPCNAYAVAGSIYCFQHHPELAAQRRHARSKGGYARHGRSIGSVGQAEPIPLDTMTDVVALLQWAINQTRQLENSLHRNNTLGSLATQLMKALDMATLEARLAEMEHILKSRGDFS